MNDETSDIWTRAEEYCTDKELHVLRLRALGIGKRRGARLLGISEAAFVRRYQRAVKRYETRRPPYRR